MAGPESWRNSSNREVSVTGNDNPLLPTVDLRNANNRSLRDQQIGQKCFKVKMKGSIILQTMLFKRDRKDTIFSELCAKFDVEEEHTTVQYPVREADGSTAVMSIVKDQFLKSSLEVFYASCEEWSTIVIDSVNETCISSY